VEQEIGIGVTSTGGNGRNPYVERNASFRRYFQAHIEELRPTFNGQEPHTLWIGCSDSRVPPELIVGARPGELFVHRNIGNMVPPPNSADGCTAAVLTYALEHLPSVRNIVVCGHSGCGAMAALTDLTHDGLEPELSWWLAQAEPLLDRVLAMTGVADFAQVLVEANVAFQIEQLRRYPTVIERLDAGALAIYGLVYDITDGSLRELTRVRSLCQDL